MKGLELVSVLILADSITFFFEEVQDGDRQIAVMYSFLLIRITEKNLAIIRATLMPILMKMFLLEIDSISDSITSLLMRSMCL